MKKLTLSLLTLAALVSLTACGKKDAPLTPALSAKAASAASSPVPTVTRAAVYDPNLKAENIVWDSPEKKKRFEEAQRRFEEAKRQSSKN